MNVHVWKVIVAAGLAFVLSACQGSPTPFQAAPLPPPPITVTTLAGSGTDGTADGEGILAQLHNPVNVAVADNGDVFVADFSDDDPGRIRRVTPSGTVSTVFTQDTFRRPFGLTVTGNTLYVTTDRDGTGIVGTSALWQINTVTNVGILRLNNINSGRQRGIIVRDDGTLVMTDRAQHILLLVDPSVDPPTVTPWVGTLGTAGFVNDTGTAAQFNQPYGLALLGADVLVADSGNHCIRRVTPTGVVSTFAGICQTAGFLNGEVLIAQFNGLQDLTVAANGTVYVTDNQNHRIRSISTAGVVSTLAGDGTPGFIDGVGTTAQFFAQEGIDMNPTSSLIYVADGNGGNEPEPFRRIRKIQLP